MGAGGGNAAGNDFRGAPCGEGLWGAEEGDDEVEVGDGECVVAGGSGVVCCVVGLNRERGVGLMG